MPYFIRLALQSLWQGKYINILAVLTISIGLLLLTLVTLTIYNLNLFAKKLPERFSVIAYLKDNIPEQEAKNIAASIKERRSVEKARYISKESALKELKASVKNAEYIFEGLDENPLPPSIEITFKKAAVSPEAVKTFSADIKKIKGVDEVQYGEKFLSSIHSIMSTVQATGLILAVIMTAGIIFICYSTVKILFYRRNEEIETFKLLGATRSFIRTPFVIEGGVIGIAGGVLSLLVAGFVYYSIFNKLSIDAPVLKLLVFPVEAFLVLPVAGLALGISGALIAIGRIRY